MAKRGHRPSHGVAGRPRFWGRHAVTAALANPERTVRQVWGTREAIAGLHLPPVIPITYADVTHRARLVPRAPPPQGIDAELEPHADTWLCPLLARGADLTHAPPVHDTRTHPT